MLFTCVSRGSLHSLKGPRRLGVINVLPLWLFAPVMVTHSTLVYKAALLGLVSDSMYHASFADRFPADNTCPLSQLAATTLASNHSRHRVLPTHRPRCNIIRRVHHFRHMHRLHLVLVHPLRLYWALPYITLPPTFKVSRTRALQAHEAFRSLEFVHRAPASDC